MCFLFKDLSALSRRFYLTGGIYFIYEPLLIHSKFVGMTIYWIIFLYASLWNQYKFIAFNIFSSKVLIISCKVLIIMVTSNEITNELTIYPKLYQNVTTFYWQERAGIQYELFWVANSLQVTVIKTLYSYIQ